MEVHVREPRTIYLATMNLIHYACQKEPSKYPDLYTALVERSAYEREKRAREILETALSFVGNCQSVERCRTCQSTAAGALARAKEVLEERHE
jgi:hypothetical protein